MLAKVNYFIEKPEKFIVNNGRVDEEEAFISLCRELKTAGIINDLPANRKSLELMWRGFRDHLVHRFTVENGKVVETYIFDVENPKYSNVTKALEDLVNHSIFQHDGNERNWKINGDSLHAKLPQICEYVCSKLRLNHSIDFEKLKGIVG